MRSSGRGARTELTKDTLLSPMTATPPPYVAALLSSTARPLMRTVDDSM
jgi:hypothetical protein